MVVAWPSAFEQRGAKQSHRSRFLERQRSGCVVHGHLTTLAADSGSLVVVSQVGELSGAWSDSSLRPGAAAAEAQVLDGGYEEARIARSELRGSGQGHRRLW